MSGRATGWAWDQRISIEDEERRAAAKLVLLALADGADDGGWLGPAELGPQEKSTLEALSKKCGLTVDEALDAVNVLLAQGLMGYDSSQECSLRVDG